LEFEREWAPGVPGGVPELAVPLAIGMGPVAEAPGEPAMTMPPEPARGLEDLSEGLEAEGDILPNPAIKSRMLACFEADVKDWRLLGKEGMGNFLGSASLPKLPPDVFKAGLLGLDTISGVEGVGGGVDGGGVVEGAGTGVVDD